MKIDAQRLRNLTTGKLHTDIGCVYEDLEEIIGERGLMTHMLPRVMDAVMPWLEDNVTCSRFWDDKFDQSHLGEIILPDPTEQERSAMLERYMAMPNPLDGKNVIVVDV